jgi:hypothetical protein
MGRHLQFANASTHSGTAQPKCSRCFIVALSVICAASFLLSCKKRSMDIVSRTVITGSVNATAFQGSINATITTGRGGTSTCVFEQLPPRFTPGTIGTHT